MSNGEPLELIITNSPEGGQTNDIAEVVIQDWKDVGIKAELDLIARLLTVSRGNANDCMIGPGSHRGLPSCTALLSRMLPTRQPVWGHGASLHRMVPDQGGRGDGAPAPSEEAARHNRGGKVGPACSRRRAGPELYRLHAENLWQIGLVGQSPVYRPGKGQHG